MKVCHCFNINGETTSEEIETGKVKAPEDLHQNHCGTQPQCGLCLAFIEAMRRRHEADGVVPDALKITQEETEAATSALGKRFSDEADNAPGTLPPKYRKYYIMLHKRQFTSS